MERAPLHSRIPVTLSFTPEISMCHFNILHTIQSLHLSAQKEAPEDISESLYTFSYFFLCFITSCCFLQKIKSENPPLWLGSLWICEAGGRSSVPSEKTIDQIHPFTWWMANNWKVKTRDCASIKSDLKDITGLGSHHKSGEIILCSTQICIYIGAKFYKRADLVFYQDRTSVLSVDSGSSEHGLIFCSFGYYANLASIRVKSYFFLK